MVIFIPYVESSLSYKFKLIFTYGIFVGLKSNKHYQVSQAQHWCAWCFNIKANIQQIRIWSKKRLIDQEGLPEEDASTHSQIPVKRAWHLWLLREGRRHNARSWRWQYTGRRHKEECKISQSLCSPLGRWPSDLSSVMETSVNLWKTVIALCLLSHLFADKGLLKPPAGFR